MSDWLRSDFQSVELMRSQALSQSACMYLHTTQFFGVVIVDLRDNLPVVLSDQSWRVEVLLNSSLQDVDLTQT